MKRVLSRLTISLMILSIPVFFSCPTFAFETEALVLPRVEILIPGVFRTIEITQDYKFPQEFNQILILAIGYGPLGINLRQTEPTGNILMLTGVGVSAAGVIPILKFGVTGVQLSESVEIGNERSPYGLLWISSWINSSVNDPPYSYTMTISF
jgi:hypothetical protein